MRGQNQGKIDEALIIFETWTTKGLIITKGLISKVRTF